MQQFKFVYFHHPPTILSTMSALTPYYYPAAPQPIVSTSSAPMPSQARYVTQIHPLNQLLSSGSLIIVTCNEQLTIGSTQVRIKRFIEFQGHCAIFQVAQAELPGFKVLVVPVYWVGMGRQMKRKFNRYKVQWEREMDQRGWSIR